MKLLAIIVISIGLSACASTPELNRELVHQQKIKTVNLNQLEQNISIDAANNRTTSALAGGLVGALVGGAIDANTNAKRRKALEPYHAVLDVMDVNKILKNALEHNLIEGNAFSDEVVIDTNFDKSVKANNLTPILTPSVVMLSNYSGIVVALSSSLSQDSTDKKQRRYRSTYTSEQPLDSALVTQKEDNKQYWLDNPIVLREKIFDGLYDVAKQFADDLNADQAQ